MIAAAAGAIVALVVSFGLIALLRNSSWSARIADRPNERSLHEVPTPRIGGIGVAAGIAAAAPFVATPATALPLACAAVLFAISFADDLRGLPMAARLAAHLAMAALVVWATMPSSVDATAIIVALIAVCAIAWMTNLFNFMDGSDGLAGAMATIGFATLAWAAAEHGAAGLAALALAVACAAAGFLAHNAPPARVFLGDSGSIPLGFLAGAMGYAGLQSDLWPARFPLVVFSPFIVDASVTLAIRIARREAFWRPHRGHCYQRLVLAGWSRRRLAWSFCALALAAALSALVALRASGLVQFGILFGWAMTYATLLVAIDRRARRADGATNPPGHSAG